MAISPPNWISYAYPSTQGWRDPRTNELLKSQAIPQVSLVCDEVGRLLPINFKHDGLRTSVEEPRTTK